MVRFRRQPREWADFDQPAETIGRADEPAEEDAAVQRLDGLRAVLNRRNAAVYARLDRTVPGQPRLLVGDAPHQSITVTPPLNERDVAVFRWGQWGARIAPVTMPEMAVAVILAELDGRSDGRCR